MSVFNSLKWPALCAMTILTGIGAAEMARSRSALSLRPSDAPHNAPTVGSMLQRGQSVQLTMIVLGSSGCGASRGTELLTTLLRIRDTLRAAATRRGIPFAAIGIALDHDPKIGLRWIDEVGGFDEVLVGMGWLNTGVIEYVWRIPGGAGSTPQVIVGVRSIRRGEGRRVLPPHMHVLLRMMGPRDILNAVGISDLDSLLIHSLEWQN
jgi:hypothetical protein